MGHLVVVENVKKRFVHEGRDVTVLKGVDLTVDEGEMVCVVGPSGAGKSTLLHILGTLDLPTSGKILYEGTEVTQLSSSALAEFRNRSIGFVFQFHHLLPEFTALENVMMPGLIRGRRDESLERRARQLLTDVGLEQRMTHRPGELSGGEQQRVALARALIMEPRLVLADEPTGNLDSRTSDAMHRLFFELNRTHGTTFLIVTHNPELAGQMPRVVSMQDGLIADDERRDVYGPPPAPDPEAAQEQEEEEGVNAAPPPPGSSPPDEPTDDSASAAPASPPAADADEPGPTDGDDDLDRPESDG